MPLHSKLKDIRDAARQAIVDGGDVIADNVLDPIGDELNNFGKSIDVTDKNSWISRRAIRNPGFYKSLGYSLAFDVIGQGFSNVRRGLKQA